MSIMRDALNILGDAGHVDSHWADVHGTVAARAGSLLVGKRLGVTRSQMAARGVGRAF